MQATVEYKRVGKSGLLVSPLALGTMQFGWSADEAASHQVLNAYVDLGGNLIDTADCYSAWAPNNAGGVSEEIIGRWLKKTGNRDQVLIATKVRAGMGQDFSEGRNPPLDPQSVRRQLEVPASWLHRPLPGPLCRSAHPDRGDALGFYRPRSQRSRPLPRVFELQRLAADAGPLGLGQARF